MKTRRRWRGSWRRAATVLLLGTVLVSASAAAQAPANATPLDLSEVSWRLPVGEVLEYGIDLAGRFSIGKGSLSIEDLEIVQGRPAYRVAMQVEVGALFFKVKDRRVSWIETASPSSLRYEQTVQEGRHRSRHRIVLDPATGTYQVMVWDHDAESFALSEEGRTPASAARRVLDELAFLYLLRLLPVEEGTYSLNGYFRAEYNPIELRVMGRETVRVPAGRFATLVLAPAIPGRNLLSRDRDVRVYVSDDDQRLIVMMTSSTPVGTARLYLRRQRAGEVPFTLATN